MIWYDLATEPPSEEEYAVLLFPCKTDCGLLYTVSNPVFAKGPYALASGYTHWARIQLAPGHRTWVEWQKNIQ
jgi:hypothetical protein